MAGLAILLPASLALVPVAKLPCGMAHVAASVRRHSILYMGNPVNPVPFSTAEYLQDTQSGQMTMVDDWIASGVPRWVTLMDELLYVLASLIFVVGSIDFFPGVDFAKYVEGCQLFIVGSLIFLGLAVFATYEIVTDARLASKPPELSLLFEQALYVIGASAFLVGTVLFTPPLNQGVTEAAEAAAAAAAAADAQVQILSVSWLGRVYEVAATNLPVVSEATLKKGDILFAIGSVLYSVAAFVSALRAAGGSGGDETSAVRRRTAVATASLYELGGVSFVVATLGFVPAGALGIAACPDGSRNMVYFGASLFLLGSLLYAAPNPQLQCLEWESHTPPRLAPRVQVLAGLFSHVRRHRLPHLQREER